MAGRPAGGDRSGAVASIAISEAELKLMSTPALVARLVADGVSRLTAERLIAIRRGAAEPGRARRRPLARH
ncbi:MAG TPA: hypothetical protein VFL61_13755 [Gaiellaceae bacterium]|nr:hypothetical protein [Gaiellaceae bacterium]